MGPIGMDITGGAIATSTSYVIETLIFAFLIIKQKQSLIRFKNLFTIRIKFITLVAIGFIGISPFIRNLANSISQTLEMNVIKEVSQKVYGLSIHMVTAFTGTAPIFFLFFPIMFAPIQASRAIASYNYGKGNMARVKKTIFITMIYSFVLAALIYVVSNFVLIDVLLSLLKVGQNARPLSKTILLIFMSSLLPFVIIIGVILLTSSTDRIILNLLITSLRGFIMFFPFIFLFKSISLNNPDIKTLF
jgi:Na+-driven multidrug efflux pump